MPEHESDTGGPETTAAVVTEHGQPPRVQPHRLRTVSAGRCLVRVTAAPVVPLDLLCASGTSYFGQPALPYVPGVSGVGEVVAVVAGGSLQPGQRVWFNTDAGMQPGDGSLAEAAVVEEAETVPLPDGVADTVAAALGLSAVAAWMALTWRAGLQSGEGVLVLGAGGVVGQVAVQAAASLGAGQVIAASRRPAARDRALATGATAVVDLDGADVDEIEARIRAVSNGRLDVVIDPVCGESATAALRLLDEGGRLVHLGASGGPDATFSSALLRSKSHSILGYTNNSLTREQRADALGRLFALAAESRCQVDHTVVGLTDIGDAWQRAGTGGVRVVVVPAGDTTH